MFRVGHNILNQLAVTAVLAAIGDQDDVGTANATSMMDVFGAAEHVCRRTPRLYLQY